LVTAYFVHEREGIRAGRGVVEYHEGSGAFYSGREAVEKRGGGGQRECPSVVEI
jgi:hypothetical protein